MFPRTVRMHLKPNSVAQFTETMEKDVIPLLRKQQGFKDEITFLPADGSNEAGRDQLLGEARECRCLSARRLPGRAEGGGKGRRRRSSSPDV